MDFGCLVTVISFLDVKNISNVTLTCKYVEHNSNNLWAIVYERITRMPNGYRKNIDNYYEKVKRNITMAPYIITCIPPFEKPCIITNKLLLLEKTKICTIDFNQAVFTHQYFRSGCKKFEIFDNNFDCLDTMFSNNICNFITDNIQKYPENNMHYMHIYKLTILWHENNFYAIIMGDEILYIEYGINANEKKIFSNNEFHFIGINVRQNGRICFVEKSYYFNDNMVYSVILFDTVVCKKKKDTIIITNVIFDDKIYDELNYELTYLNKMPNGLAFCQGGKVGTAIEKMTCNLQMLAN